MEQSIKDQWVEALRSGEYDQGMGYLRTADDEYCCLGVLCQISDEGEWKLDDYHSHLYKYNINGASGTFGFLPSQLRRTLPLDSETEMQLINLNDSDASFDEIADWIEENV